MTSFKIVFTFDVFFSAETTCTARWHAFYIRNRHISVSFFVYKYDQWPHDSHMTGRAGVWEADDIVQFYIALLKILKPAISGFYIRFHPVYRPCFYFIRKHMTPFYWQEKLPDNWEYIKIQEWLLKQSYVQRNI
jgi:hypothetical protein